MAGYAALDRTEPTDASRRPPGLNRPPEALHPGADDVLLTQPETARYLRVSIPTLERWRKVGIGPTAFRVGHAIRYRLGDIRSFPQPARRDRPMAA
jgi:hypothetical protein